MSIPAGQNVAPPFLLRDFGQLDMADTGRSNPTVREGQPGNWEQANSGDRNRPRAANATLFDLQKPEKLSQVLKNDVDDCLACRVTGECRQ